MSALACELALAKELSTPNSKSVKHASYNPTRATVGKERGKSWRGCASPPGAAPSTSAGRCDPSISSSLTTTATPASPHPLIRPPPLLSRREQLHSARACELPLLWIVDRGWGKNRWAPASFPFPARGGVSSSPTAERVWADVDGALLQDGAALIFVKKIKTGSRTQPIFFVSLASCPHPPPQGEPFFFPPTPSRRVQPCGRLIGGGGRAGVGAGGDAGGSRQTDADPASMKLAPTVCAHSLPWPAPAPPLPPSMVVT